MKKSLKMRFYDFIEIGTSDFDTEIQKHDTKCGISIEPIKYYLDRLPNKVNCIKLNMGVSDYSGTCIVNYLSEKTIKEYNFPDWVRGCNSINSYHATVSNLCEVMNINIDTIIEKEEVEVSTLTKIMTKLCIDGLYFLKIDTEGHDTVILKNFYETVPHNMYLPHVIQFECNILSNYENIIQIIQLFLKRGYDLIHYSTDTVLKLNLKKLKDKTIFTKEIKKYYIMDYPPNYTIHKLPHENTLESAKEYCIKHNCSGITLQDGIYQVRDGKYINYTEHNTCSWIFL